MTYYDADRYYDYQREAAEAEHDAYVEWCEDEGLDPAADNDAAWQDYKDACAEDAAEEAFERQQDAWLDWAEQDSWGDC